MRAQHKCPRCQEMTEEKFYCLTCRDLIKKPPLPRSASNRPDWEEWRQKGKSL